MSRLLLTLLYASLASTALAETPTITWKKQVIDPKFRSEGVAVADLNKDGKKDVVVGEFWYEGPDFSKRHEIQKPGEYGDGLKGYSHVFAVWADDLNGDGYTDIISIDFPGEPCYWLENPKGQGTTSEGKPTHWKKHTLWHSACNETPIYTDLFGKGQRVLVMGFQPKGKKPAENEGQMAYFTPNKADPTALWEMHPISEPSQSGKPVPGTFRYAHGLGVGDLNGDGRLDVLTVGAWWEQPSQTDGKTPWKQHPNELKDAAADMYAVDVDGDGKADILNSSAHKFGIWWHKQRPGSGSASPSFQKKDLFPELVSETHAAHFVDIDGDGLKDFVTGKRWWSHGRSEPGADKAATVYWFKATKNAEGMLSFKPMVIDEDFGIGTQFEVTDINGDGLLDIITSNKKGVHVVTQQRK